MRTTRRDFLGLGTGVLALGVGATPGAAWARWLEADDEPLDFGPLEELAARMQECEADALLAELVERLRAGTALEQLAAAGALANARTHGGVNYDGYHAFMALVPAVAMARLAPPGVGALPVLKVLHRNTRFIRAAGGRESERLKQLAPDAPLPEEAGPDLGPELRRAARAGDLTRAEALLAAGCARGPELAYGALQPTVQDEIDVHQVVLAWRVWDTLALAGREHAETLLRTSLRHSLDRQAGRERRGVAAPAIRTLLPELLEQLGAARPEPRRPSDEDLEALGLELFGASREDGARAMAAALGAGYDPLALGGALSLAADRLLLCDPGRSEEQASAGKPAGSVHGASVGVHASDSARAWRNIARTLPAEARPAALITGAFHLAGDARYVGADEFPWRDELGAVEALDGEAALAVLADALGQGDQRLAVAAADRCARAGVPHERVLEPCLRYGTLADGALHAEKYFLTALENLEDGRPAFRARTLRGLARVTASEQGFEAPGLAQARELLDA